jgi:hypothetical protein
MAPEKPESSNSPHGTPQSTWGIPIPMFGVTGDVNSGKSTFLRSIAPGPRTCIYDTEKGHVGCERLGFKRVDVPDEMLARYPGGYRALDTFVWWRDLIRTIPPGRFDVIALDVAEDIEQGLCDWVWENPLTFNHTREQYVKMSGIYWGDVAVIWKQILTDLAARCQTFAFAVHTGVVWVDKRPTQQKKPKGKRTLMELATLYLHLDRPLHADGGRRPVPTARVLKARLPKETIVNGRLLTVECLPPQLPEATPEAIRAYMATPPNWAELRPEEKSPEKPLTEEQWLEMRTALAQAEAERLRIERMAAERAAVAITPASPMSVPSTPTASPEPTPASAPTVTQSPSPVPPTLAGETLQQALANPPANGSHTPTPSPDPAHATTYTDGRLRVLGPDVRGGIHRVWDEIVLLLGLDFDQGRAAWKGTLATLCKVEDLGALTECELATFEERLIGKLRELHAKRGTVPPF